MTFGRFVLRRAAFALVLVVVVSSAAVLLTLVAPGDYTTESSFGLDAATLRKQRADLGLDRPILVQYAEWISRAARFDFGNSLLYTRPVSDLLGERARNTAVLGSAALAAATLIGI